MANRDHSPHADATGLVLKAQHAAAHKAEEQISQAEVDLASDRTS